MRESELVLRARGGDEVAFRRLINLHLRKIHWLMGRYYKQGSSPDDLRQAILIGLHKAVRDYKPGRGPFVAFVMLCMQRMAITAVKEGTLGKNLVLSHSLRLEHPTGPEGSDWSEILSSPNQAHNDPYLCVREKEELAELVTAVGELTELERASVLGLAEGHTYEQLADSLGVSFKSVDNAAQRAWRKLSAHRQAAA